jgi:hypothetical protein
MVKRRLNIQGKSLWGRNLPWAKKYHIYARSERWLLCDSREDKAKKIKANNRIEVCLRKNRFEIKLSRLGGAWVDHSLLCNDLSERGLRAGLRGISLRLPPGVGGLVNPTAGTAGTVPFDEEQV